MRPEPMVVVHGHRHTRGASVLVDAPDAVFTPGSLAAVTGVSGVGKSTLLRLIGGVERPMTGVVLVGGADLGTLSDRRLRRFRRDTVAFVPQDAGLVPSWTVRENLVLATRAVPQHPVGRPCAPAEACAVLGVDDLLDTGVHALSGGERQRVALARVLVRRPALVLLDEPTAALDTANTAAVIQMIQVLSSTGATVVVATHDAEVMRAADQVVPLVRSTPVLRMPHKG
jgi:ABC-type lipoprotein export system ATPase subunit